MQKTGSLLVIFLFIRIAALWSQDVQVTATVSETNVFVGERFAVNIEISGERFRNVSRPELPDLPEAKLLTPVPSTSSNFSFVNGKATSAYTFTFYYLARQEGKITVPAIEVVVDGKPFQTKELAVTIRSQQQMGTGANGQPAELPDIFVKMEVSNRTPLVGEQIIAEVVLYFKNTVDVQSYQPIPGWKAEGFWKEELNDGRQPQATSTIIDGQRFRKASLIRYALFPSKSGKLDLGGFQVNCTIRYSSYTRDPFASFFGGMGANQKMVEMSTEPIKIDARPVPDADSTFSGAVGKFTFKRSAAVKEALVGESVEIITTVEGTGNIALITRPAFPFPAEFEVYEPQEKQDINRRGDEVSGKKTFVDVVVARKPGEFVIPERALTWYDAAAKKLVMQTLPAIALLVKPDPRALLTQAGSAVAFELKPWNGLVNWYSVETPVVFSALWWFWGGLGLPLLVVGVAFVRRRYLDRMENDPLYARTRSAGKAMDKRLSAAKTAADSGALKDAYGNLHIALTSFIADRLKLPPAGISDADLLAKIPEKALPENRRAVLKNLLQKCATIRFAPVVTDADFRTDLNTANDLLSELRRKL